MEFAFLQGATDTSDLETYTFASQNLGTAAAGRYIIVCVEARASASRTLDAVSVGGVSATIVASLGFSGGQNRIGIAIAAVPAGTTGTVVVTFSVAMLRCAIQLYRVVGLDSGTPSGTWSNAVLNPQVSVDIPAGGFGVACALAQSSTAAATWAGLTEDYDAIVDSQICATSASGVFASQQTGLTVQSSFTSGTVHGILAAAWAPAATSGSLLLRRRRAN